MSAKYNQCRYLKQHTDERCTGEAVDPAPDALIVLCTRHLALALELVREARSSFPAGARRRAMA